MNAQSERREETYDLLQINKALLAGNGDRIAMLLADYIRARHVTVSKEAWSFLKKAVRVEQIGTAEKHDN